jgi:hypothetical protein
MESKGEHRKTLTSEEISKRFKNQFDFVNYAIKLAENMIQTGRQPYGTSKTENPALWVLEEIVMGNDKIEELPVSQPQADGYYSTKIVSETKFGATKKHEESFHEEEERE